jgi:hypothetical protein
MRQPGLRDLEVHEADGRQAPNCGCRRREDLHAAGNRRRNDESGPEQDECDSDKNGGTSLDTPTSGHAGI